MKSIESLEERCQYGTSWAGVWYYFIESECSYYDLFNVNIFKSRWIWLSKFEAKDVEQLKLSASKNEQPAHPNVLHIATKQIANLSILLTWNQIQNRTGYWLVSVEPPPL